MMTVFGAVGRAIEGALLCALFAFGLVASPASAAHLAYGWQIADGVSLFYREGGPPSGPTIVFLHGNPSSSIQYQEVMQTLAGRGFHVIAMDYPSFGYSDAPDHVRYRYTFDNVAQTVAAFLKAKSIQRYALYMQDYGVPIGFRLMAAAPDRVSAIMVQNGVIHLDGFPAAQDEKGELRQHWEHRNAAVDARRRNYIESLKFPEPQGWAEHPAMSPDAILLMTTSEQRPGVIDARTDLWFDYGSNVALYPEWQALLRRLKLPALIIWGSQDDFFTVPGAVAYLRDAPQAEVHILNTVHFATLEAPDAVSAIIAAFARRHGDSLNPDAAPTDRGE
jgi:pimeloyl-ACP methyl ester carboxylesterase